MTRETPVSTSKFREVADAVSAELTSAGIEHRVETGYTVVVATELYSRAAPIVRSWRKKQRQMIVPRQEAQS